MMKCMMPNIPFKITQWGLGGGEWVGIQIKPDWPSD